ncbi:MAG: hypothetical protein IKW21_01300 [Lachnospiraceae bacterium]|nr:hypothetical protein [Lachnospiraceae bacterium]
MEQGWISVYRRLQDHWLWEDKPFSKGQAWIDLIMLANHEDKKISYKGEIITCKSGDVNRSILQLSKRWGWGRDKTRKFLALLEADGMVTVNATKHRTTITIENYGVYRHKPATKRQPNGNQSATSRQQADINNNDNNYNNENNIYSADPKLDEAITEFVAFRKKIKKPMTDHAVQLMMNKLNRLSSNVDVQIEILNQSIMNGWQGIFPLKEPAQQETASTAPVYGANGIELDESKNDLDEYF